jgi:hypothetical protein
VVVVQPALDSVDSPLVGVELDLIEVLEVELEVGLVVLYS